MSVNKYDSSTQNLIRIDGYSVDENPTSGSSRPVSSGGVYTALNNITNVQSDWNQNDPTANDYIKNKPNISGNALEIVTDFPENPTNGQLLIYGGNDYANGDIYRCDYYINPLRGWKIQDPSHVSVNNEIIYTNTETPTNSSNLYDKDYKQYSTGTVQYGYKINSYDSNTDTINITIYDNDPFYSQPQWNSTAVRDSSEDIFYKWTDLLINYIYNSDWEAQGDIYLTGRQIITGHTIFTDGEGPVSAQAEFNYPPSFNHGAYFGFDSSEDRITFGSGGSYYIDEYVNANFNTVTVSTITTSEIQPNDSINGIECQSDIDMNYNNLESIGNTYTDYLYTNTLASDSGSTITVGSDLDLDSQYNINNASSITVNELYVSNITAQNGNEITINNDISLSGNLAVSGTITDGSGNSLVYDNDSRLSDARTPSNDNNLVHKTGNESISGNKTFSQNVNITGELSANTATVQNLKANSYNGYAEYLKALNSSNIELYRFVTIDKDSGYLKYTQADEGVIIGVTTPNALITGSNQSVASGEKNVLIGLLGSFWVTINPDLDLDSLKPGDYVCAGDSGTADSTTTTSQMRNDIFQVLKVDIENRRCLVLVK